MAPKTKIEDTLRSVPMPRDYLLHPRWRRMVDGAYVMQLRLTLDKINGTRQMREAFALWG